MRPPLPGFFGAGLGCGTERIFEVESAGGAIAQLRNLGKKIVAQPRRGGKLHPMRLLVQAHPQAKIFGFNVEFTLNGDHVRGEQHQTTARLPVPGQRRIGFILPKHFGGEEREHGTDLEGQPFFKFVQVSMRFFLLNLLECGLDEGYEHDRERLRVCLRPGTSINHQNLGVAQVLCRIKPGNAVHMVYGFFRRFAQGCDHASHLLGLHARPGGRQAAHDFGDALNI